GPVHDVPGRAQRGGVPAVLDQADRGGVAEDAVDRGSVASPQDAGGAGLGGGAPGPDRGVLSAGVFAGVEPGGVFEQRPEGCGQRGRPAARPADAAGPVVGLHEALGSGTGTGDKLLSASVDSIRRSGGIALILLHAGVIFLDLFLEG